MRQARRQGWKVLGEFQRRRPRWIANRLLVLGKFQAEVEESLGTQRQAQIG